MSVKIKITLIALTALLSLSCRTNRFDNSIFQLEPIHDFETAPLIGIVYSSNNVPCSEAIIEISHISDSGAITKMKQEITSDINGRFMIPEVIRGRNEIVINKKGFEEGRITFDFLDMTKVFYIQMKSLESLLDEAEEHLDKRELIAAEDCISRALSIDDRCIEALYLKAVHLSLTGDDEGSKAVLDRITEIDPEFKEML